MSVFQRLSLFRSPSRLTFQSFAFYPLYHIPLSSIISGYAISHHLDADDNQLYVSFASGDSVVALNGLQACLASVQSLMSRNKLNMSPDKTEFLLIGIERQWSKITLCFLLSFSVSKLSARKLGAITKTKTLPFYSHISAIDSSYFSHIRDLRSIHRHLDLDIATLLTYALVSSHLDYCNSFFSGSANTNLTKPGLLQFTFVWYSRH